MSAVDDVEAARKLPPDDRRCTGISKTTGDRCTAYRARDLDVCAGHGRLGLAGDPERYSSEGGKARAAIQQERARKRGLTAKDLLAQKLEEHAEEVVDALLQAIRDGDWRAGEAWLTRVYGKPAEPEKGADAGLDLTQLSASELEAMRKRLIEQGANVYPLRTQEA